jgi:hypothetical protein
MIFEDLRKSKNMVFNCEKAARQWHGPGPTSKDGKKCTMRSVLVDLGWLSAGEWVNADVY